ncbi:MAG: hypothetical protein ACJ8F7_15905 [Gemmataceae bacterium]
MMSRKIAFIGAVMMAALVGSRAAAEEMAPTAPIAARNFTVEGTSDEAAELIRAAAEKHRARLAEQWLGKPLPAWKQPCPIHVSICEGRPGGATTFDFRVFPHTSVMRLSGTLESILHSVLPHEVAHTVLADYFHQPLPRWADEGAAILCESGPAPKQYDRLLRDLQSAGRTMRLSQLFGLRDYPQDIPVLYSQGYSVSRFLVERKDRRTYLQFIKSGLKDGWAAAAAESYGFDSVDALETAWLQSLRRR